MFLNLFDEMKNAKIPVSLREYLTFLEALTAGVAIFDVNDFYYLARSSLVKDERHIDRFDQVFSHVFKGLEQIELEEVFKKIEIPHEWIKKLAEKTLSKEEMEKINSLGSFEKLMETLKKRLAEQKDRHQGGNKWVGTAGTSPFGAYGYNPEGIRIGQHESRHKRAVKVWDKRDFKNFDSDIELGTRGMKVALKRLRRWARDGADEELDLENTISSSAKSGFIDVRTRPERRNSIKVIIFLMLVALWMHILDRLKNYSPQLEQRLSILNTITFIIVSMKECGKIIIDDGLNKHPQQK